MSNIKNLIILRGVSGCGKSTTAEILAEGCFPILEADKYFEVDGIYQWDKSKIHLAHQWCQKEVEYYMSLSLPKVITSNTSTTEKELKPYLDLAEKYGYRVISLIVENRHGGCNCHDVPEETLDRQEQRLRNSLKLR